MQTLNTPKMQTPVIGGRHYTWLPPNMAFYRLPDGPGPVETGFPFACQHCVDTPSVSIVEGNGYCQAVCGNATCQQAAVCFLSQLPQRAHASSTLTSVPPHAPEAVDQLTARIHVSLTFECSHSRSTTPPHQRPNTSICPGAPRKLVEADEPFAPPAHTATRCGSPRRSRPGRVDYTKFRGMFD